MNIGKGDIVYFLGIGGIGMSALARYFQCFGAEIHGYDKTATALTDSLQSEGMQIHFDDRPDLIPAKTSLIVYTPAVPKTLKEFQVLSASGKPMMKRAEVLGSISRIMPTIAVAGTHGKTSVSSMIAHILHQAGVPFTAFIGGIANNFHSNLVLHPHSRWLVVEADEYDRSFLHLRPHIAVVTSMDPDHLDIYGNHENMVANYRSFAGNVIGNGHLILRHGLQITHDKARCQFFAIGKEADFTAEDIQIENDRYRFTMHTPAGTYPASLSSPGQHNVLNALAAAAACMAAGIEASTIAAALTTYKGVRRRFDIIINYPDFLYIDDYAHHPEELKAAIGTARSIRPGKHLTGIFQPHLYSRTRDFMDGFAESLSMLDRLILLDIYPARELPIDGISSAGLLEKVRLNDKILLTMDEALSFLKNNPTEVLMTLGAGDIDRMVLPLKSMFER